MAFLKQCVVFLGLWGTALFARFIYSFGLRRGRVPNGSIDLRPKDKKTQSPGKDGGEGKQFEPNVADVFAVKAALSSKFGIPLEIIDCIIDCAEYWPHTSTTRTGDLMISGGSRNEDEFLLRSYPLGYIPKENETTKCHTKGANNGKYLAVHPQPSLDSEDQSPEITEEVIQELTDEAGIRGREHPCRKIVFTIKGHDQGWGGTLAHRGTFVQSYTWWDVGKERITAIKDNDIDSNSEAESVQGSLQSGQSGSSPEDLSHLEGSVGDSEPPTIGSDNGGPSLNTIPLRAIHHRGLGRRGGRVRGLQPRHRPENTSSDSGPVLQVCVPGDGSSSSSDSTPTTCTVRTILPTTTPGPEPKFHHGLLPDQDNCIQRNLVATRVPIEYRITWSYDDHIDPESIYGKELDDRGRGRNTGSGEYVRNLKIGDVVTVWGKARFGGWANHVEKVKIDVYWAV